MRILVKRIVGLSLFALVLFVLQYFLVRSIDIPTFYSSLAIYTFHYFISLFIVVGLYFVYKQVPNYTGYTFLVSSAFRMLASIVFLIPLMKADVSDPIADILTFMIPYFLFLIFEVFWALHLMKN